MKFSHSYYAPLLMLKELDNHFANRGKKHSWLAPESLQKATKKALLHIGKTLYSLAGSIAHAHKRRVAMRELYALDDRALQDIGLSRGQVRALVAGMISLEAIEAERDQARNRNKINHAVAINDSLQQATIAVIEQEVSQDKQEKYCCGSVA